MIRIPTIAVFISPTIFHVALLFTVDAVTAGGGQPGAGRNVPEDRHPTSGSAAAGATIRQKVMQQDSPIAAHGPRRAIPRSAMSHAPVQAAWKCIATPTGRPRPAGLCRRRGRPFAEPDRRGPGTSRHRGDRHSQRPALQRRGDHRGLLPSFRRFSLKAGRIRHGPACSIHTPMACMVMTDAAANAAPAMRPATIADARTV